MRFVHFVKMAAAFAIGVVIFAGTSALNAQSTPQGPRVLQGLAIAPVPLNLTGKDINQVGLGSYLVNAVGDCNGCHTGGAPPNLDYLAGRNPFFNQTAIVNPKTYLNGGSNFGPVGTPTGPMGYQGPNIIARNLTPDKTGLPEGGHTLAQFMQIIRNGTDFDHIHPTCTAGQITAIEGGATPNCIPTSPGNTADGNLLQVMPWPTFSHMTDGDLQAIWEYLSAIPCIANPVSSGILHNDCK